MYLSTILSAQQPHLKAYNLLHGNLFHLLVRLPITCYLILITCYLLPVTRYPLPVTCSLLLVPCYLIPFPEDQKIRHMFFSRHGSSSGSMQGRCAANLLNPGRAKICETISMNRLRLARGCSATSRWCRSSSCSSCSFGMTLRLCSAYSANSASAFL